MRSRVEVRVQSVSPIILGETCSDQRVSPVLSRQVSHPEESVPVALGSQHQGGLHSLAVLTSNYLRRKLAQLL